MKTKSQLQTITLNSESGIIRSLIELFVAQCYPFDFEKSQFTDNINYKQPGKPEDSSAGYIAYDVGDKPRMKLRTARYLTRKCKLNQILTDAEIRTLADKINGRLWTTDEMNNIELVHGQAITDAYRNGIGGNSCMSSCSADYTKLYAMNPERFRMIIVRNGADSARAIVHKLDNGEFLMDRIYTTAQNLKAIMIEYAESKNWYVKTAGINNHPGEIFVVSGLDYKDGEIPYMDTMTCGIIESGLLRIAYMGDCDYDLQSQDGSLENGYCCESCGEHVHGDNIYHVGDYGYCENCINNNFTWCESCDEYVDNDDTVCIEDINTYVCSYCASSHYHKCVNCNEYNSLDGCYTIQDDILCQSCYEDSAGRCEDCNENFYNEDLVPLDNETVCRDCEEIREKEKEKEKEIEQEKILDDANVE